jgi:hypothetical protein
LSNLNNDFGSLSSFTMIQEAHRQKPEDQPLHSGLSFVLRKKWTPIVYLVDFNL